MHHSGRVASFIKIINVKIPLVGGTRQDFNSTNCDVMLYNVSLSVKPVKLPSQLQLVPK
jgi:hypothetical protein